jgi:hypothetical protein
MSDLRTNLSINYVEVPRRAYRTVSAAGEDATGGYEAHTTKWRDLSISKARRPYFHLRSPRAVISMRERRLRCVCDLIEKPIELQIRRFKVLFQNG